jgi:hypothetical protein
LLGEGSLPTGDALQVRIGVHHTQTNPDDELPGGGRKA